MPGVGVTREGECGDHHEAEARAAPNADECAEAEGATGLDAASGTCDGEAECGAKHGGAANARFIGFDLFRCELGAGGTESSVSWRTARSGGRPNHAVLCPVRVLAGGCSQGCPFVTTVSLVVTRLTCGASKPRVKATLRLR
jgi:hypothetical protein